MALFSAFSSSKSANPLLFRSNIEYQINWEFNNRSLYVPFTGTPFITNSSQSKHCEHGNRYYKLKTRQNATRCQPDVNTWTTKDCLLTESCAAKRREIKPTKKRNCPACLNIREVILFPEYCLPSHLYNAPKHVLRKEKASLIGKLKQDMPLGGLTTLHRFFVHIPLPEAHACHPGDTSRSPLSTISPAIRTKIDELLRSGHYEPRHIQLIVYDYICEAAKNSETTDHNIQPTRDQISDYIYLSRISAPTIVEVQTKESPETPAKGEVGRSAEELKSLLRSCSDEKTLRKAKRQMVMLIWKLRNASTQRSCKQRSCKQRHRHAAEPLDKRPKLIEALNHVMPVAATFNQCNMFYQTHNDETTADGGGLHSMNITSPQFEPVISADPSILATFSRLMEVDHDVLPSLVDHMVSDASQFHHITLSSHLHNV